MPTFRAAGVGVAAGGESGVGGVDWTVLGPESGRVGPVPSLDRVQRGQHLGAELSGVDFGEDRRGERGTGSWSGTRFLKPRLSLFPRPSDFVLDFTQSSGTRSGLYWVGLGPD